MNCFPATANLARNARRAITAAIVTGAALAVTAGVVFVGIPVVSDAQHIAAARHEIATSAPWYTSVDEGGNVTDHYRDEAERYTRWGTAPVAEIPISGDSLSRWVASFSGEVMSDPEGGRFWVEIELS